MNNTAKSNIEVELRGVLTKDKYKKIIAYLKTVADNEEVDDKISYFFVIRGGILKISDEEFKNKAKISYKQGGESKSILEEYEIPIAREDVQKTIKVFKDLGFTNVNTVQQKRINFKYKGAEISIKDTPDYGPHFEIEMIAKNQEDAKLKRKVLFEICKDLDLKTLSQQEIKDLIISINTKHGFIKNG